MPHDASVRVCPATGRAIEHKPTAQTAPAQAARAMPTDDSESRGGNGGADPIDDPTSMLGKTLSGRYMLRDVLGSGGMGTVYEAEHLGLKRAVAIKVLNPSQARKKTSVKRFQQEARAAGSIGHPNICEVYDLGSLDDGSPYLVMEKLTGRSLAQRIQRDGRIPPEEIAEIMLQALSGLNAAHDKGIVHRDIKPDNIFIAKRTGAGDIVKIVDFGVSKMMVRTDEDRSEDLDLTRTGMVMGTPYYMSPEQASGERKLDARVDIYACGVVMYEAATGRRPFLAPNYNALLLKIISGKHKAARELVAALPAGFDTVVNRAMAVQREHRYANASEMQRDLISLRASTAPVPRAPQKSHASVSPPSPHAPASRPPSRPAPPRPLAAHGAAPPPAELVDLDETRRGGRRPPIELSPESFEVEVQFTESDTGQELRTPQAPERVVLPDWEDEAPTEVFRPAHLARPQFRAPIPLDRESATAVNRPGIFDDDSDEVPESISHLSEMPVTDDMGTLVDPKRHPRRR